MTAGQQDPAASKLIEEDDPVPAGTRRWLISCDESGTGGAAYYGFGSLWMPWQRRGDFAKLVQKLRVEHPYAHEVKWNKVHFSNLDFYRALVEAFFKTSYLHFHCLVVRKADVDVELHGRDWDLARRKHFTMLLTNKIKRCVKKYPDREQTFRIWVDPIASRYTKADEAVEVISNNVLGKVFGKVRAVDKVLTRDSKQTPSIGLCDLLLGAVMETWQQRSVTSAKHEIRQSIAQHLGWTDLAGDTFKEEVKFNIWYFYDSAKGQRDAESRAVTLLYPLVRSRVARVGRTRR